MNISHHARVRWIERVDPSASLDDAARAIGASERAIEAAATFGCSVVRLGNGARLVLAGDSVLTVMAPGSRPSYHLTERHQ